MSGVEGRCGLCGQPWSQECIELSCEPPSVPTEQADGGVVVPRDQLETLRRSLELGSLLPGEGETLINCWIFASEAESKA